MNSLIKKGFLGLFIVLIFGLVGTWDIQKPNLYTCHDAESHVVRLLQYERSLHDGQFPVEWAKTLYGGIGSPVLMLNYQLPYYLAMIPRSLGVSIFNSFKSIMALSFILSGLFAYVVFRRMGTWQVATVAAIIYMWTPYHFLDLYVRCAYGELVGFMFVPLIILGMWENSSKWLILGWAGLFLSHPVMSAFMTPFLLGWIFLRHFRAKNWGAISKNIYAFILAVGIACFNLLPTLSLTKYTQYSPKNSDTYEHFVTVEQLLINHWGYGFSMPGDHDEMSFAIGYVNLFVLVTALIFLVGRRRFREDLPIWYLFIVILITFVFTHKISRPFYELFHLTRYIDFPWRLLMVQTIGTPLIAVWVGAHLPKRFLTYLMIVMFGFIWVASRNNLHINATWPFDINYYVKNSGSGDAFGEYSSIYRTSHRPGLVTERLKLIDGSGQIDYIVDNTQELIAKVDVATGSAIIRYNIMHFPGWNYRIDGYEMPLDGKSCWLSTELIGDQDYSGLVECRLEPGTHRIIARWISPSIVVMGKVISLLSLAVSLWLLYRSSKGNK